jgi:ABC-type multidrug transport system fused ATPase/permease subunit
MNQNFINESDVRVDQNIECYYTIIVSNRWLSIRLEMIGNFIVLFTALFAVIYRNELDASQVGLIVTYALSSTESLNWLVRCVSDLENK